MKRPEECCSLDEIRTEIDRLDRQIVTVIAERHRYVRAASRFKTDEYAVRAPDRLAAMLRARRGWAEEHGLDPNVIEELFGDLVTYFIQEELNHWNAARSDGHAT